MTTHILGIDPGLTGALVLINKQTKALITYPMPTEIVKKKTVLAGCKLAGWLGAFEQQIEHAYVEQVSSRPRQAGQFQFGINTGILHGMLYANNIPFTLVPPAQWKFHFALKRMEDETYRDKKNDSRALAAKLFPAHAKAFARVKDDGVSEAALIALYGLNQGST